MTHVGIGIKIDPFTASLEELKTVGVVKREAELVAESIHRLINTSPGERLHAPTLGSRIYEAVFEPNDAASITLAAFFVADAIQNFEPRVRIEEITPLFDSRQPNKLGIEITFRLVQSPETLFVTATEVSG
jgi:phage baseplate assembly protein W